MQNNFTIAFTHKSFDWLDCDTAAKKLVMCRNAIKLMTWKQLFHAVEKQNGTISVSDSNSETVFIFFISNINFESKIIILDSRGTAA